MGLRDAPPTHHTRTLTDRRGPREMACSSVRCWRLRRSRFVTASRAAGSVRCARSVSRAARFSRCSRTRVGSRWWSAVSFIVVNWLGNGPRLPNPAWFFCRNRPSASVATCSAPASAWSLAKAGRSAAPTQSGTEPAYCSRERLSRRTHFWSTARDRASITSGLPWRRRPWAGRPAAGRAAGP